MPSRTLSNRFLVEFFPNDSGFATTVDYLHKTLKRMHTVLCESPETEYLKNVYSDRLDLTLPVMRSEFVHAPDTDQSATQRFVFPT